jgi:hypothetical protein
MPAQLLDLGTGWNPMGSYTTPAARWLGLVAD